MWPQTILPPNTIQKTPTLLKHSKQDSASVAPLHKHNSVHQDDPTKATILNEQFQSVFSRKSPNSLSSLYHMKLQESTDADRSMLDITVTSKHIEKLLSNLNPHPKKTTITISSKSHSTREPYHQSGRMLM